MPFKCINPSADDEQFLLYPVDAVTSVDNTPIFLIPGILGCGDIDSIAYALTELNPDRPIHLWEDPDLRIGSNKKTSFASLESQARAIKREIMKEQGSSKVPPVIVGFSSGCAIAALTAKQLLANHVTPFVYIIDGASRALMHERFTNKDKKSLVSKDLILIMETIAKLAGVENPPRLPDDIINVINKLTQIEERAKKYSELLCDLIKKSMKLEDYIAFQYIFDQQFRVVHRNLRNMRLTPETPYPKLPDVIKQRLQGPLPYLTAFFTQEQLDKHPETPLAGWQHEAQHLTLISSDALSRANHLDLVENKTLITYIAQSIIEHLNINAEIINTHITSKMIDNTKNTIIDQFSNNSKMLPRQIIIDLSSSSLSDEEKSEDDQENHQGNFALSASPTSSEESKSPPRRSLSPSSLFAPARPTTPPSKPASPTLPRKTINTHSDPSFLRASF